VGNAPVLLVRLRSEPERAAILLDVDGTLAPIVPRPEDAAVPAETRVELERLAGLDSIEYVGVHGLEADPQAKRFALELEAFAERIPWPWTVENKGGVTLSFHYREAPDEDGALRQAEEVAQAAEDAGLTVHRGRKVIEVRPPVAADKGTAVRRLLNGRQLQRGLYAGDDTTDLDAFRGLEEAGLEVALKVAVGSPEMNPALLTRADLVVDGPGELLRFLRSL
jgi:trehalose 6-phosphate phosphatase